LKFIFSQLELDGLFRTCYQAHSLEALQLFHRPRCAAGTLVDIELYYGVTGPGLLTFGPSKHRRLERQTAGVRWGRCTSCVNTDLNITPPYF
jgi:hypothetical protein